MIYPQIINRNQSQEKSTHEKKIKFIFIYNPLVICMKLVLPFVCILYFTYPYFDIASTLILCLSAFI